MASTDWWRVALGLSLVGVRIRCPLNYLTVAREDRAWSLRFLPSTSSFKRGHQHDDKPKTGMKRRFKWNKRRASLLSLELESEGA